MEHEVTSVRRAARRLLRGLLLHLPLSLVVSWLAAIVIAGARYPDLADEARYERLVLLLLLAGPALVLTLTGFAVYRILRAPAATAA